MPRLAAAGSAGITWVRTKATSVTPKLRRTVATARRSSNRRNPCWCQKASKRAPIRERETRVDGCATVPPWLIGQLAAAASGDKGSAEIEPPDPILQRFALAGSAPPYPNQRVGHPADFQGRSVLNDTDSHASRSAATVTSLLRIRSSVSCPRAKRKGGY